MNLQYYIRELLYKVSNQVNTEYKGQNLFARLAQKLQRVYEQTDFDFKKRFAFVSFNQDTILDNFLCHYFSVRLWKLSDYVSRKNPFFLFKPHGSWNWGWEFPIDFKLKHLINISTSEWLYQLNVDFFDLYFSHLGSLDNMLDWNSWGPQKKINRYNKGALTIDKSKLEVISEDRFDISFPALLLPYRDKDDFTMPHSHVFDMENYLNDFVETLVIIGWKGNEAAFNKVLLTKGNKIKKLIIADPNQDEVINNLKSLIEKNKVKVVPYKGFEHFMMDGFDKEISSY